MKVLLVAPRKNDLLSVDEEIQDILGSNLTVSTLMGRVTATELLRKMRDGDFDVLWLATHGDDNGIELSGLERISAAELVPQVRGRFSLVVLNTCNGLGIAQLLQEEANVGVICSLIGVGDNTAYQFGSRLASALAESLTIADAYLASKPGRNSTYLYLPALRVTQDSIDSLLKEMKDFRGDIEHNNELMEKDRRWRWRMILLSVGLHPVTWVLVYILFRLQ